MVRIFGPVMPVPVAFAGPVEFFPIARALSAAPGPAPAEARTYPLIVPSPGAGTAPHAVLSLTNKGAALTAA
jgi:hypothetical protein